MSSQNSPKERLLDEHQQPDQTAGVHVTGTAVTPTGTGTNQPPHPVIVLKLKQPPNVPVNRLNAINQVTKSPAEITREERHDLKMEDFASGGGGGGAATTSKYLTQAAAAFPPNEPSDFKVEGANPTEHGNPQITSSSTSLSGSAPSVQSNPSSTGGDSSIINDATRLASVSASTGAARSSIPPGNQPPGNPTGNMQITDAIAYLDRVRTEFSDQPDVYNRFLQVMRDFKANK